jgi:hypothetical protein
MEREIEKLRLRMIQLRGGVRREKNGAGMPESKAVQTRRQAKDQPHPYTLLSPTASCVREMSSSHSTMTMRSTVNSDDKAR